MFQSFFEWQNECLITTASHHYVHCPECDGEGSVLEECECCGQEKEVDCKICHTTGEVLFGELSLMQQSACFSRRSYNEQLARDVLALADWLGGPLSVVKYGFAIATDIRRFSYKKRDVVSLETGSVLACM